MSVARNDVRAESRCRCRLRRRKGHRHAGRARVVRALVTGAKCGGEDQDSDSHSSRMAPRPLKIRRATGLRWRNDSVRRPTPRPYSGETGVGQIADRVAAGVSLLQTTAMARKEA